MCCGGGLGNRGAACGGGRAMFGGGGLNWTGGGGIGWPCCSGWPCQAGCPATCIGVNAAFGGGGRCSAGTGPGATAPSAKGRGGTGAITAPLAWVGSVAGPLANRVWGLLFWLVGLLAAKTLSASMMAAIKPVQYMKPSMETFYYILK